MNSAGFVAEYGSIWLNADNISSISNFNLNSVFGHKLTHNVTGKDTELLANFGEARASGFKDYKVNMEEKASVENKIRDNRNALNEYEQISKKSKQLLESILEVFHNSSDTSTFQEIYYSQIQEDNKIKKEFEREYIALRKKKILLEEQINDMKKEQRDREGREF